MGEEKEMKKERLNTDYSVLQLYEMVGMLLVWCR